MRFLAVAPGSQKGLYKNTCFVKIIRFGEFVVPF